MSERGQPVVKDEGRKSDWQDISSVPKDGTAVLLFDASYRNRSQVVVGWWRSDRNGDRWIIGGGGTVFPTHWQPLPFPPIDAEANANAALDTARREWAKKVEN